jgi:hypothetical protein
MKKYYIEQFFSNSIPTNRNLSHQLWDFHLKNYELIYKAKGSESKHQAWEGGYIDHLEQCISLGDRLYYLLPGNRTFSFWDVFVVLYLHDIEKIWKYTTGEIIDKEEVLSKFSLTDEQRIAIKYIHEEREDYGEESKMNELGALCHCCDVLSARFYYDKRLL